MLSIVYPLLTIISDRILHQILEFVKQKRADAAVSTVRPPFSSLSSVVLLFFRFPPFFPFGKLPLALLAFVESKNIRHETAGDSLNLILGNVGVID